VFQSDFHPMGQPGQGLTHQGNAAQESCQPLPGLVEPTVGTDAAQIIAEGPHVVGDGHLVIIEDHDNVPAQGADVVQRLKGHAPCEGSVPDHRHHLVVLAPQVPGNDHTCSRGNGGRTVSYPEMVVCTLAGKGKAREPAPLA